MGKQANIRNVSVTTHTDDSGKSMLIGSLISEAGIITESMSEVLAASAGCVDRCITLKVSHRV